jgi:hypothetical protein
MIPLCDSTPGDWFSFSGLPTLSVLTGRGFDFFFAPWLTNSQKQVREAEAYPTYFFFALGFGFGVGAGEDFPGAMR